MGTDDSATVEGYVDIYLLPVPKQDLEAYRREATTFGKVAKEHGALGYRELRGEDLGESLQIQDGEVLTAPWPSSSRAPITTRSWHA